LDINRALELLPNEAFLRKMVVLIESRDSELSDNDIDGEENGEAEQNEVEVGRQSEDEVQVEKDREQHGQTGNELDDNDTSEEEDGAIEAEKAIEEDKASEGEYEPSPRPLKRKRSQGGGRLHQQARPRGMPPHRSSEALTIY
jgi:hypothetical protein